MGFAGQAMELARTRETVLGSATPSMETFRHARAKRYELLRLGGRIEQRPLAEVRVVDMRDVYRGESEITPLSSALADGLRRRNG